MDLPEDQLRASKAAITFSDTRDDFNYLDWTWTAPIELSTTQLNANLAASALRAAGTSREFGAYNFGRPRAPSIFGGSTSSRHPSHDGESTSHLDSQDFSGVDLGLNLGDMSVEQGRDAMRSMSRERRGDSLGGIGLRASRERTGGREKSLTGGMDMTFDGQVDLGLDFGADLDFGVPELEQRSRRECESCEERRGKTN